MKKHEGHCVHKLQMTKIKGQTWKFSSWLWPYLVIPSCVAALIALFFFIIIPPLRHGIGSFGVAFWLSAFAIWIVITISCTILWVFASRHLLTSDYYLISYMKTGQGQDQTGLYENSCVEGMKSSAMKSNDKDQCLLAIEDKVMKDHNCGNQNGDQPLLSSELSQQDFDVESKKHVLHEKLAQSTEQLSTGQLSIPESHPPRRVSYAGVISVTIPAKEELESDGDEQDSDSKLRAPRPPTPRFPRGMRVSSAEKNPIKYTEVSIHQQQQSTSSEPQSTSEIFHFEEKKVSEPRVSGEIEHIILEKVISPNSLTRENPKTIQVNGLDRVDDKKCTNKYTSQISETRGRIVSDMVDFKRRNLSDEERSTSIDRTKRMSMDRNQFLGWNPDEGILAEADPGSKKREEIRWRKSIETWHRSISASYHEDSKPTEEIVDEEELDDVFQDKH